MPEYNIRGKRVKVDLDGEVFVDGNSTDLKKSTSYPGMWMTRAGSEIKALQGKSLEEALIYKGKI